VCEVALALKINTVRLAYRELEWIGAITLAGVAAAS
jgi:DNA-binding transcriptional regulator YhcF (GntR family)